MTHLHRRLAYIAAEKDRRTPKEALAMIETALEEAGRQPTTSGRRIWYPFASRADFEASKRRELFYASTGITPD